MTVETKLVQPSPGKYDMIWTAPIHRFVRTTIEGLTSRPIILTSYYSQSGAPGHHNHADEYVWEPAIDEGVPQDLKDELAAKGIAFIYGRAGGGDAPARLLFISDSGEIIH